MKALTYAGLTLLLFSLAKVAPAQANPDSQVEKKLRACVDPRHTEQPFRCLVSPVEEVNIKSPYGHRTVPYVGFHRGADLRARYGAEISASFPGTVTAAGWGDKKCGQMVSIAIGDNSDRLVYCHLSRIDVKEGDSVSFRTVIGRSGDTGDARGAHAHIQFLHNGEWVDPIPFMIKRSDLPEEYR